MMAKKKLAEITDDMTPGDIRSHIISCNKTETSVRYKEAFEDVLAELVKVRGKVKGTGLMG